MSVALPNRLAVKPSVRNDVDLDRLRQVAGVDALDGVVHAGAVGEQDIALALRELGEHVVELARGVLGLACEDVVVERARVERREHLRQRAASDARQQDELTETILGDLAPVLARQRHIGRRVEVRQAEGWLAYCDRARFTGPCCRRNREHRRDHSTAAAAVRTMLDRRAHRTLLCPFTTRSSGSPRCVNASQRTRWGHGVATFDWARRSGALPGSAGGSPAWHRARGRRRRASRPRSPQVDRHSPRS